MSLACTQQQRNRVDIYDAETNQLYARMSWDGNLCLSIEPDIDVAFMTALALMWDMALENWGRGNSGGGGGGGGGD